MNLSLKIATALFILIFIISSIVLAFAYDRVVALKVDKLRDDLLMTARLTAALIDGDAHARIPLSPAGIKTPEYQHIREQLKQVKAINPLIKYIYTLAEPRKGVLNFVVDAEDDPSLFSRPGDPYDISKLGKSFNQFLDAEVRTEMLTDKWGTFISGYAPIRTHAGKRVALLGVDMLSNVLVDAKRVIRMTFVYVFVVSLFLSLLLGTLVAVYITKPLKQLLEGTRIIAAGNLNHQVPVRTHDEIGELARSFNDMAVSLKKSYNDLKISFMSTIRSLMAALEAKDPYTRGHSDRVARYCAIIAEELGLPTEEIRSLEDLALMHDIGKIGIKEEILNKPDYLTEKERKIIEQHATIGEDILKPIAAYHPGLLELIRSHHERPDGTGYPDGLTDSEIPLLVSILTVADAYDAMVTDRPYRKAQSQEFAFRELYAQAGKQYNLTVVKALEQALTKKETP